MVPAEVAPIVLHVGIIHYVINMMYLLGDWAVRRCRDGGFHAVGSVAILANFMPNSVSVGPQAASTGYWGFA
jgi:hypothetical protein